MSGAPASGATLRVGDRAPHFVATAAAGEVIDSRLLAGRPVVLFFFPRAETLICTREACAFRDGYADLLHRGALLLGCSGDTPAALQAFAERHRLRFPLISDADGSLRQTFGLQRRWGFLDPRVTFVIGPDGVVRHVTDAPLSAARHVEEAMRAVTDIGLPEPKKRI